MVFYMLESASMKHDITITNLPGSMVSISGELAWDVFSAYEQKAFARLAEHLELDGFRKGNVPEAIARKHIPDELLLNDMAELALSEIGRAHV